LTRPGKTFILQANFAVPQIGGEVDLTTSVIKAALLLSLSGMLPVGMHAQEWPRFGGPSYDFTSTNRLTGEGWSSTPPTCVWRARMTDKGYACPSVADGSVFVIDHAGSNDVVRALALDSGRERWRFSYPDTAVPANGFARAAPTWDEGRLYTLSRLGHLHCLEARTGQLLWQKHYVRDFGGQRPDHSFCAPPSVWGERLYLCPGGTNGCVVALDKRTGATLWRGGPAGVPGHAIPVITRVGDRNALLCFSATALLALNPATGATYWTYPRPTPFGNNIAQPLNLNGDILVSSGDGMGTARLRIKEDIPRPVWESKEYHTLFATPVVVGDLLFLSSNTRRQGLTCASLSTGKVHWVNPRFDKYTTLLRAGDRVLALESAKGDLVLIAPDASSYREVARFKPLGKLSWTPPILTGDRLVIRNATELACFRLSL